MPPIKKSPVYFPTLHNAQKQLEFLRIVHPGKGDEGILAEAIDLLWKRDSSKVEQMLRSLSQYANPVETGESEK